LVNDRLCGVVVRIAGYSSRVPGSIPDATSGSGQENRIKGRGDPLRWPRDTLYTQKVGTNFAD
jgi:hypothetical protein